MALETNIIEFPFAQGQNEGAQRELLPLGQLSVLNNARFRRDGRLGKRYGYDLVTTDDIAGDPIGGSGPGYVTALGSDFVVIDDRFYRFDQRGGAWGVPPIDITTGSITGTHLRDRWPQFLPGPAFAPLSVRSDLDVLTVYGTDQASTATMTLCNDILYTATAYWRFDPPGSGSWIVRVVGTDERTGRNVFQQDILASGDQSDAQQPHLCATGNGTLVLVTDHFTAAAKDGIRIRLMTDRTVGFSSEYTVACVASAVNNYIGDSTHILITYSDGTANTNTGNWSVSTQSFTTLTTTSTGADGIPERLSVYGVSGSFTWVGFRGATSTDTRVRKYDSSLASVVLLAALDAKFSVTVTTPVLFIARPDDATRVVIICGGEDASGYESLCITDATGTNYTGQAMTQAWCESLSWPFAVGADYVYMWVRHKADPQLGVATLVRIPYDTEFGSGSTPFGRSLPIEATLDDEDIDPPVEADESGPTFSTPQHCNLGYVACLSPTVETFVSTGPVTQLQTRPLLVPVRHRSEDTYQAQSCVVPVIGKQFVPSAQPMFVDAREAVEAGFVQAPAAPEFVSLFAGGDLTVSSAYQYCAVYLYQDARGRIERSAPSLPLSVSTTASQTVRLTVCPLELSKKVLRVLLYRTKANQKQFYFLASFDATPAENIGNPFTLDDTASDTVVGSNEQLYTQIGQELANSQFPACQFATEGDGRLWVGGGFKPQIIQASKNFHPRLSVEFCDDDAFRVTLPAPCTGLAWLDSTVAFTEEGIYVITGAGPDVSGVGSFDVTRLPTTIGCINWRSVVAFDGGIFFQSHRGLCLLPRGFGAPVFMDQVVSTLGSYPYITSSRVIRGQVSSTPPVGTVQFACLETRNADSEVAGRVVVFEPARGVWSVDTFAADQPGALLSDWSSLSGTSSRMLAQTKLVAATDTFRLESTGFADNVSAITMRATTGDIRPWGTFAHGVINRVGVISEPLATCTLNIALTTENGSRTSTHSLTDDNSTQYHDSELNKDTLRDVNFLRVELSESSTTEGVALIHMVIEHDVKPQGFRLLPVGKRAT